ncbi:hypothetical protein [Xylella taiwanensis]|nr:hypothetical protein [Xylella taiwanensis]
MSARTLLLQGEQFFYDLPNAQYPVRLLERIHRFNHIQGNTP